MKLKAINPYDRIKPPLELNPPLFFPDLEIRSGVGKFWGFGIREPLENGRFLKENRPGSVRKSQNFRACGGLTRNNKKKGINKLLTGRFRPPKAAGKFWDLGSDHLELNPLVSPKSKTRGG